MSDAGTSSPEGATEAPGPSEQNSFLQEYLGFTPNDVAGWFDTAASDNQATDDAAPLAERLVSDPETLRAISDPLRIRILETMVSRADNAWSVKELAAALEVPQTRLYHHIELLLECDLIKPAGQRLVSGIVETRYRIVALALRLDPRLIASDQATTETLVTSVLDSARGELLAALRETPPDPDHLAPDRPLISRGLSRLSPERAAELRARLVALLDEFDDGNDPALPAYGLLLALYPIPTRKAGPE
jgi:DNA-binding transcriptional ArsR family regulator